MRFTPATGIAVCGYAADRSAGVDPNRQNIDYDTIRDLDPESFTYSLNTTGGTSGSPVFYVTRGEIRAVGVHSRENDIHTNRGCRLTDAKVAWIRAVRDEIGTRDVEVLVREDPQDVIGLFREETKGDPYNVNAASLLDEDLALTESVGMEATSSNGANGTGELARSWDEDAALDELAELGAFDAEPEDTWDSIED